VVGTERRFNGKAGIFRCHFYSGDLVEIKPALVRFARWLARARRHYPLPHSPIHTATLRM
jgi:hypothetical protein